MIKSLLKIIASRVNVKVSLRLISNLSDEFVNLNSVFFGMKHLVGGLRVRRYDSHTIRRRQPPPSYRCVIKIILLLNVMLLRNDYIEVLVCH